MSDRSFDDLMASMGVQKLNPGKARLKAPASIKQAPLSQKHRKNERSPEPPAAVPKGPSKAERRLRAELSRAQDAARSAQQELAESEERLASLRAELDKALKDQVAQEANLNRLRTELAVARGDGERWRDEGPGRVRHWWV